MPFVKRRGRGAAEWWKIMPPSCPSAGVADEREATARKPKACAPVRPEGSSRNPIGRTRGGRAEPLRRDFSFHRARLYLAE